MASIYELNGRVPVLQAVPFGLQHVLAMFVANITPIIILANVAGVNAELSAALIQNCMVVAVSVLSSSSIPCGVSDRACLS